MITFVDAIRSLRPNAEWRLVGTDVADIEWLSAGVAPLSQTDVDAEIVRLEALDGERRRNAESARLKIAKALGLSDAEMIALGFGPQEGW